MASTLSELREECQWEDDGAGCDPCSITTTVEDPEEDSQTPTIAATKLGDMTMGELAEDLDHALDLLADFNNLMYLVDAQKMKAAMLPSAWEEFIKLEKKIERFLKMWNLFHGKAD